MGLFSELQQRNLIVQLTHPEELQKHFEESKVTVYCGLDPTADSYHVGHLMALMYLSRLQKAGHRVICVMGAGTAMIGDPTGKTSMRPMLTRQDIDNNVAKLSKQVEKFVDLSDPKKGILVNNADWLTKLNYLETLREIGPHFSVNRMLTADCFKSRMEEGLSFLEFNYMILQSYDFLHLHNQYKCTVQIGGDDQWSNMLSGVDLIRRIHRAPAYCLTWPLLTTSDGRKMGKTEKGAVWLDPSKTSPYEYFQYWRNVEDQVALACLGYFTYLPQSELTRYASLTGKDINQTKEALAYEATKLLHGDEEANKAQESARRLFNAGDQNLAGNEPLIELLKSSFGDGLPIVDFLVITKIAPSKGEARRLVEQGGVSLDANRIDDISFVVTSKEIDGDKGCLVKKGKKNYYRVKLT